MSPPNWSYFFLSYHHRPHSACSTWKQEEPSHAWWSNAWGSLWAPISPSECLTGTSKLYTIWLCHLCALISSLTLLQPHWPPYCSSNPPATLLPQGLCTGWSLCLMLFSPDIHLANFLTTFMPEIKCYLLSNACSETLFQFASSPHTPHAPLSPAPLCRTLPQQVTQRQASLFHSLTYPST